MKFAMMSDTHYISRRMIADKTDKELMLQPAVTEAAVRQALENNDVLFIIGDLTDSGDRYSHEDFAAFLKKVKEETGKKIYVTFATHDYHHHKAYVRMRGERVTYRSSPWDRPYFDPDGADLKTLVAEEFGGLPDGEMKPKLVEALSPEEIRELYRDFGLAEAYSVDGEGFSYCLDLDGDTRCLMLNDYFRNEEALKDKSPTYTPSCFRWMKRMLSEAERDGKYLFLCSHHPMLPASPAHRIGAGKENRDMRSPVVGHTLADMGFNLVFTGHSHFCDVGYLKSEKGNIIRDITTPSVRFYPPAFRNIDISGGTVSYDCEYIRIPEGEQIEEKDLFEHYHAVFYNDYYRKVTGSNELVKKVMDKLTVGDIYFLLRRKAKLTAAELNTVKDVKIFDLIIETAFNMLTGDGRYTPETPEYKILMTLSAKLDSIINTQPFVDVKNRYLGGYGISDVVLPLLFNSSEPDREGVIDLSKEPEARTCAPVYTSAAGVALMGVIYVIALVLSLFAPVGVLVGIPAATVRKMLKEDKGPYYKYN